MLIAALVIGASVSGGNARLCEHMGGKFTPNAYGAEQCPGGAWANVVKKN